MLPKSNKIKVGLQYLQTAVPESSPTLNDGTSHPHVYNVRPDAIYTCPREECVVDNVFPFTVYCKYKQEEREWLGEK